MPLILGRTTHGMAVFANKDFKKGESIIVFKGKLLRGSQIPEIVKPEEDRYVQIDKDHYLGPSGGLDDYFNHSCHPNAGLKITGRKVLLVAIKRIKKDQEITWDYSTTMDEDYWEMDCACNGKHCRARIRDYKHLPKRIQQRYVKLGIVPDYLLHHTRVAHHNNPLKRRTSTRPHGN